MRPTPARIGRKVAGRSTMKQNLSCKFRPFNRVYVALVARDHSVAIPALLYHKDKAKGTRCTRSFPCMEATYPYAIKDKEPAKREGCLHFCFILIAERPQLKKSIAKFHERDMRTSVKLRTPSSPANCIISA